MFDLLGAAIAFLLGCGIATGNYALSRRVLKTAPNKFSLTMMARQIGRGTRLNSSHR